MASNEEEFISLLRKLCKDDFEEFASRLLLLDLANT